MFRKSAVILSTLALVAGLGLSSAPASAKPFPKPFPHHHGWMGPLALFGAAAVVGATIASERSNCTVAQQAVDGPDGPYIRNVTICN